MTDAPDLSEYGTPTGWDVFGDELDAEGNVLGVFLASPLRYRDTILATQPDSFGVPFYRAAFMLLQAIVVAEAEGKHAELVQALLMHHCDYSSFGGEDAIACLQREADPSGLPKDLITVAIALGRRTTKLFASLVARGGQILH